MFWYYDYYYIILVLPAILITLWAQVNVKNTFAKYSRLYARCGKTAAQVAREMLDDAGLYNVRIERVSGTLSDHFDPKTNVVRLSDSTYLSSSVAAIGVAAHEVGHAMQYSERYVPIRIRAAIIPITKFGSTMAVPLIILAFVLNFYPLVQIGILLFGAVVLFQLITLPVEINASRRALAVLQNDDLLGGGFGNAEEYRGAKKVLTAAALTYVAALLVALMNLLRLILRYGRRRD